MHSGKTLLFLEQEPWTKKVGDQDFDVPMGCYEGAEVCQLVGSYILNKLENLLNKEDVALYRYDGLGVLRNMSRPQKEQVRKNIIKVFKDCDLSITIKIGLHIVDFLDVQLNRKTNTHKPYRKPNNDPIYINCNSNHPSNVLKELPQSNEKGISDLSSNENIPTYDKALKSSGFNTKLTYQNKQSDNENEQQEKRKRKRKIIWFNPTYAMNVKTNIGKEFFKLLNKHFPRNSELNKLFNKNTVKLSYSCTKNMDAIITAHNNRVMHTNNEIYFCNCRQQRECPLQNKCLTPSLVYKAIVTNNVDDEKKFYIGLTETDFKQRFNNHTKSFRHRKYSKETELSKYVWNLKDQEKSPIVTWSIIKRVKAKATANYCKLCLTERHYIIKSLDNNQLLNVKSELVSKCRHTNKNIPS